MSRKLTSNIVLSLIKSYFRVYITTQCPIKVSVSYLLLQACDTIRKICRCETSCSSPDHSVPNFSSLSLYSLLKQIKFLERVILAPSPL